LVTKASEGRRRSSNRLGQAPATRRRAALEVEGTPGAVDCEPFREGAWETALEGRSRFGEACWAGSFERGRFRTAAGFRVHSKRGSARARDRGCPSQSGWGKSTAASGCRDGGWKGENAGATPDLRKLGWSSPARDAATRSRSGSPLQDATRFGRSVAVLGGHSVAEVGRRHVAQALR
jgi:hypothetical protein